MKTKVRMHPLRRYLFAAVVPLILLPLITRFDYSFFITAGFYLLSALILSTLRLWIADDGDAFRMTFKVLSARAYERSVKRQPLTIKTILYSDPETTEGKIVRRVVKFDGSYFFSDLERCFFGSETLFLAISELYSFDEFSGDEANDLWDRLSEDSARD